MRRVVSLYLPTWPTDRIRKRTGPCDKPLVTASRQGSRRVLMAVDQAAGRCGLKAGMTVAHAQALVPDLAIAEADTSDDAAGLLTLAAWTMRRFSPIAAPDPPDGLFIDSTGCEHLFGGEESMLADLHRRLTDLGIAVRIGMADTPGAAYAMARFIPGAITVVRRGGTEEALRHLPVAALRLPADITAALFDLGFKRIGQLVDAPRSSLAVRFGQIIGQRLDWALGKTPDLIAPYLPESMPQRRLAFAEPLASTASLERAAQDLALGIADDLEQRDLGARVLDLLFERVDKTLQAIRIGLARPSRDRGHFTRLFRERLDTIDPGFGIDAVTLVASRVEPLSPCQLASAGEENDSDVSEVVDRLANLPSVRRVHRLTPVESDVPERSVRRLAAVGQGGQGTWPAWPRPTRLIHPSEPVIAAPSEAPERFVWRGRSHSIRKLDGPERIHGEWWRSPDEVAAMRDYYRVEDETGAQFWMYRTGDSWHLQGLFG